MLFPELIGKRSTLIDLNLEAKKWLASRSTESVNPLLDPTICQNFVVECHQKLGIDFSYGGWLEDRSTLWRGSYLDQKRKYIHLGVDFNVPAGTQVAIERAATVIYFTIFEKSCPRLASVTVFLCFICDHLLCPDILEFVTQKLEPGK